jgi:hypothetical protein
MISVLIPTYGRPERLAATLESIARTGLDDKDVEVFVRICVEDPCRAAYKALAMPVSLKCLFVYEKNAQNYGQGIEVLRQFATGDILMAASDDVLFRTPGWHLTVEEAFAAVPDRLLVAYANDGRGRRKPEHPIVSRRWIDTLGYFMRTEFRHFCVDQWIQELAEDIGRLQYLDQVITEHMHVKYGKAAMDDTYAMVRGNTRTSEADNALYATLAPQRAADLRKLLDAMQA